MLIVSRGIRLEDYPPRSTRLPVPPKCQVRGARRPPKCSPCPRRPCRLLSLFPPTPPKEPKCRSASRLACPRMACLLFGLHLRSPPVRTPIHGESRVTVKQDATDVRPFVAGRALQLLGRWGSSAVPRYVYVPEAAVLLPEKAASPVAAHVRSPGLPSSSQAPSAPLETCSSKVQDLIRKAVENAVQSNQLLVHNPRSKMCCLPSPSERQSTSES